MSTSRIDGVKAEAGRQTNTVSSAAAMLVENRFIYKLKVVGRSRCCGQPVRKTANRANQNGSDGGKLRPTGNGGRSRGRHGSASKSAWQRSELHRRHVRLAGGLLEVLLHGEVQGSGHYGVGELAHEAVVGGHGVVEHHAAHAHVVLVLVDALHRAGVGLVGLKLRVLLGHEVDAGERAAEQVLLGGGFFSAAGAHYLAALGDHVAQRVVFMFVVGTGKFHEGGHRVPAAVLLHAYLAHGIAAELVLVHELALYGDEPYHQDGCYGGDYDNRGHDCQFLFRYKYMLKFLVNLQCTIPLIGRCIGLLIGFTL